MKNGKRIVAIAIAAIMMISVIAPTVATADAPRVAFEHDADNFTGLYVNPYIESAAIRIYGEADAIYPTHSYSEADDFIYPDAVDPFDPGIISKDSLTFNPAYIDRIYKGVDIRASGGDTDEKVFLRLFYEPGYAHPKDALMNAYTAAQINEMGPMNMVVTETTYMLVDHLTEIPVTGNVPDGTRFMLPYRHTNETPIGNQFPGMDTAEVLDLVYASDSGTSKETDGAIEVEKEYLDVPYGTEISFMDHNINVTTKTGATEVRATVKYVGNMVEVDCAAESDYFEKNTKYYFSRSNLYKANETNPAYRWYMKITRVSGEDTFDIYIGRRLVAGETFYVDGVRYDMPAIYVVKDSSNYDAFKYITFQSPIPKCEDEMWNFTDPDINQPDWSHVTSQWLANLLPNTETWVLPPFNEDHVMRDDIGLIKIDTDPTSAVDWEVPEAGIQISGITPALVFNYTQETTEERFNTSLAERHYVNGDEEWDWWSVYTKPINFTEFVLPDQETTSDTYYEKPTWYPYTTADGYEYLLTSSFIAPNCEDEERHTQSKSSVEVHDIIDRSRVAVEIVTLTSVTVTPSTKTLNVSETQQFTATAYYSDSSHAVVTDVATWSRSPTNVGTISATGLFTAIENGTTTVTATYTYDSVTKTGTAVVTVGVIPGDIDGSGEVDIADAMYLAKHVLGMSGFETIYDDGDVDSSGEVDIADAMYLAKHVLGMSGFEELYP